MIEELTPAVLATSMAFILLCAPILTAVLSAFFLWRYRRAVVRAMSSPAGTGPSPIHASGVSQDKTCGQQHYTAGGDELFRLASRAPLRDALECVLAILVAAIPLSLAAQMVYPAGLGLAGFAIGLWLYTWPAVPACALVLPRSPGTLGVLVIGWFLVYALLSFWGTSYLNVPAQNLGGVNIPARSGVTPARMALLWASVNAVPTALVLLCFNRFVRAVAPLVLALVTLVLVGIWSGWMWISMPTGLTLFDKLISTTQWNPVWVLLALALLALVIMLFIGWALVRWISRRYRDKAVSDRSLALDAVYLAFIATYGMWLVMGGLIWLISIPVAFGLYRLVLARAWRLRPAPKASRGLCYLRVFALGRRSERLSDAIGRYWRNIGSIQLITGPDVATGTVQPHQFLDFLSGKLDHHFIADQASLARSIDALDTHPDPDRRFRINGLFCYADTWQSALPALVAAGEALIMDLRGFSADNDGCREELEFVAARVPARQCLLIVDDSTDLDFLHGTLGRALAVAPAASPNAGVGISAFQDLDFRPGDRTVRQLLQHLCESGAR